ncbi:MAG: DUF4476 domain-containing protein [Crocinitomicaceae bacterium]|jgi:hypothetical protein|nr:DUF4476 domain-containing protein [Crocinitomicaceae bacterium]MDP4723299.1 DUF4476 domain-containing protein [Crocinitomicaceae bacterium]MDP4739946.1 DUF4476 domain-containing protein [Crocinitomicaceae bacterium]MDP4800221.1 DUF4476 domain-containing protein [Crocinitomicaceae bacterium]MDP4806722.1 DUF4476 domain-containing protein [Crocinitomicaceae bacterium]
MKTPILLLLLFLSSALFAQSNLSIFNNNGQSFYVVLNGIRQNSKPETNVQVGQIKNGSYAVKVIFADGKTPDIDKNFLIDAPYDITARIIFKKGKGKLQLMGQEPTHGVIQEAVVYRPTDAATYSDAVVVITPPVQTSTTIQTTPVQNTTTIQTTGTGNTTGINMNVNIQETPNTTTQTLNTTTTTTTTTGTIPDENVNLNMNLSVGGVSVNLNANASGTGLGTGATITETSSSSSSTTTTQVVQNQQNQQNAQQQQVIAQVQQAPLSSRVNCTKTMNRLEAFKAELQDQSFEEDRLEALQLELKSTCLTSAQAEQLIDLFTFDENRLEVAKYLSDRLTDRDNAGALAKKLTFDSNKMEYRRYISE